MSSDDMSCNSLMLKLQQLEFAAVDLNLYLDNHPENKDALCDYNAITKEISKLKKLFELKYGPLSNFGTSESLNRWAWVDDPWPWEHQEREV